MQAAISAMNSQLHKEPALTFDGIRIDTAANRMSVMVLGQYDSYKCKFELAVPINESKANLLNGIGESGTVTGEARIQIPFSALDLVIDVTFSILKEDAPSLLINRDMIDNGLEISLEGRYIYV